MDNGSAKGVAAHGSVVAQLGRSKIQQSFHENDDDGGQGEHARNGGMHASGLRAGTNEDVSPWRISRCLLWRRGWRGGAASSGETSINALAERADAPRWHRFPIFRGRSGRGSRGGAFPELYRKGTATDPKITVESDSMNTRGPNLRGEIPTTESRSGGVISVCGCNRCGTPLATAHHRSHCAWRRASLVPPFGFVRRALLGSVPVSRRTGAQHRLQRSGPGARK